MAQPANLHSKTQQSSRVLHPPVGQSLDRWRAFEHNYSVGQIGRHDKVVFHHKSRLLGVKDKSEQRRMTLITWTLRPLTCSTIFLSLLNSQVLCNSLTPGGHLEVLSFVQVMTVKLHVNQALCWQRLIFYSATFTDSQSTVSSESCIIVEISFWGAG